MLGQGAFVSHEHETTGSARIVRLADGSRTLEIVGRATSDAPDLRVWLSDQPVRDGKASWGAFDNGAHVELGRLKGNRGNRGNQAYPIPSGRPCPPQPWSSTTSTWCSWPTPR